MDVRLAEMQRLFVTLAPANGGGSTLARLRAGELEKIQVRT